MLSYVKWHNGIGRCASSIIVRHQAVQQASFIHVSWELVFRNAVYLYCRHGSTHDTEVRKILEGELKGTNTYKQTSHIIQGIHNSTKPFKEMEQLTDRGWAFDIFLSSEDFSCFLCLFYFKILSKKRHLLLSFLTLSPPSLSESPLSSSEREYANYTTRLQLIRQG